MPNSHVTNTLITQFVQKLHAEEKSSATIEKYVRDVNAFAQYAGAEELSKDLTISYKHALQERRYALSSINSMLASLNSFLTFCGRADCKVKLFRIQHRVYLTADKELSKAEYLRLLKAANGNRRLNLLLQTICATGIRVSELQYFTVSAVRTGEVTVACKNKSRKILLPGKLQKLLLAFARDTGLTGVIFCTRSGKPMNRSNIWASMKRLCAQAKVNPGKVFPHNLRKLFARTFYSMQKDIAKLADLLGHSNINTTRIYIMTTGQEHRRQLECLGLVASFAT